MSGRVVQKCGGGRRERSRRRCGAASLCGLLLAAGIPQQVAVGAVALEKNGRESLQSSLREYLAGEAFAAAQWGIQVVELESGRVLFEHQAEKLLKPASNAKLYTGALGLDLLGPDHQMATSLYSTAAPDRDGVLPGDLVVYGRGDPSLAARFYGGDYGAPLERLVRAVEEAGIRRIQGDLVGDESYFTGPHYGAGWAWDDLLYYYGAPVSALTLQENVIDLLLSAGSTVGGACAITMKPATTYLALENRTRTTEAGGSARIDVFRPIHRNLAYVTGELPLGTQVEEAVTILDPAHWFIWQLREALEEKGIHVGGQLRTVDHWARAVEPVDGEGWHELGRIESRPMHEIVSVMMKRSQNLYAQLLLLQAGRSGAAEDATGDSEEAGLRQMKAFLERAGIDPDDVLLEEGSGLSRGALLKPSATVGLLRHMREHAQWEMFRDCLAIAGVDGTLRRRFKDTPLEGKLRGKTGTLRYVHALSGYLESEMGNLAFSVMLNQYDPPAGAPGGREAIDGLLLQFVRGEK